MHETSSDSAWWRSAISIQRMFNVRNAWVRRMAVVLFFGIILVTTSRVSPPAALQGVRPSEDAGERRAPAFEFGPEHYVWLSRREAQAYEPLCQRIAPPDGYRRVKTADRGFAAWLRRLPVAPPDSPVRSGRRKVLFEADDPRVAAVIALQPTSDRLLAGANMLTRLRGEYLWATRRVDGLAFHFTSGDPARWDDWAAGMRPVAQGREVSWKKSFEADAGRESFCGYLETVFRYGSAWSVKNDTAAVTDGTIAPGDVFLAGRSKDESAVLVLDAATNEAGGLVVLLGDCGRPARTFFVLRGSGGSPWFSVQKGKDIVIDGQRRSSRRLDRRELRLADLRRWK